MNIDLQIPKGKFGLVMCEIHTGIILNSDAHRSVDGDKWLFLFDSLAEAEKYAEERVNSNPLIECSIADESGKWLISTRNPNYKDFLQDKFGLSKRRKGMLANIFSKLRCND